MNLDPNNQKVILNSTRIRTLDSLRGLAAISVVIAHYLGGIIYPKYIDLSPLYIFKAAHEAVIFFFILSGYVLVYQYGLRSTFNYKKFIISRFFRIYIPYIIAIVLCFLLYYVCEPIFFTDNFIGKQWKTPFTFELFLDHILLINNFDTNEVLPVIWSLVHEMRIAIIFPVLIYILRFDWIKVVTICFLILVISIAGIVSNVEPSLGHNNGYFYSAYYFYVFVCGGLIAKYQPQLVLLYEKLTRNQKVLLLLISLSLYVFNHVLSLIMVKTGILILFKMSFIIEDFLTTLAAFYFMIAAISIANKSSFLEKRFPLLLGKVSYSLYLIHLPVVCLFYNKLHASLPMVVILVLSLVVSLGLSIIYNKYIELPAAKVGKRLLS